MHSDEIVLTIVLNTVNLRSGSLISRRKYPVPKSEDSPEVTILNRNLAIMMYLMILWDDKKQADEIWEAYISSMCQKLKC